jgi:hypothetical protein
MRRGLLVCGSSDTTNGHLEATGGVFERGEALEQGVQRE